MTAPNLSTVPDRILSPEEFDQAQAMSPSQVTAKAFPAIPVAPRESTRTGPEDPNPAAQHLTGLGRILTQYVAQPILDHPLTSAATALIPGAGYAMAGMMGKDIVEYAAQKVAEAQLPPDVRKMAEADPTRIPGEQAAVEAVMLGAAPAVHGAVSKARAVTDVSGGMMEAGAKGVRDLGETGRLSSAVRAHMADLGDSWAKIFTPASRSTEAGQAAGILRSQTGAMAAEYEQAAYKLDEFRRAIDPLPEADKLGFIDAIEGGRSQPSPEFQEPADLIRKTLDDTRDAIRNLGTGKLEHFIQDYFPHIWEDPERAAEAFKTAAPEQVTAGPTIEGLLPPAPKPAEPPPTPTEQALAEKDIRARADHFGWNPDDAVQLYRDQLAGKLVPKTPTESADALQRAKIVTGSKRPMEGSKSFLKQRTIPTTLEGMQMGLKPVTTNPVDLTLLKLREMQRYLMAHRSLAEMRDAGVVKYVASGEIPPDGYQRIDDKIATVFGPRQGAVGLPEGANIAPEDVTVHGMRIMGQYYAPEPVATVVNNYLSPGLQGNAIFDAYRGIGNSLNQAQLGFSAFHLGMTSLDATVSRAALGLEHIAAGRPLTGVADIISAPAAPLAGVVQGLVGDAINKVAGTDLQIGLGAKIRQAYLRPETATPDMQALANAVKEAGGRVTQDSFYKNSAPERMMQALKDGHPVTAARLTIPALLEVTSKPIMEHIVPLQKLGVFGDLAKKVLADLPDNATLADRRAALASAWDSVDNRMGQLVYDNLFWNRTVKDLAMASVRSVGWNLGTIRELGGGVGDLAGMGKAAVTGGNVELTHKAAYALALPMIVGLYGATYQLLRTGEAPSEFKDYFYPKTGDVDADGNPERVQLPSYMKDMMAYAGHPWETVKHKVSPQLSAVVEMLNNADYYGDQIRNPDDPFVTQFAQEAKYVAKTALPFAISNMRESAKRGDDFATRAGMFVGVTPAPREAVRSDAQNLMAKYLNQRGGSGGATPEDAAARQSRSELLGAMRANDGSPGATQDMQQAVTDAIERHQLTAKDVVQLLKRAGTTPAQEKFKRLTLDQALEVFKASTPREQAMFAKALLSKVDRAIQRGDPVTASARAEGETASVLSRPGYQGTGRKPLSAKASPAPFIETRP